MASRDIPAGAVVTPEMINILKPAKGLPPSYISKVIGSRASVDITKFSPITADMLEGGEELCGKATFAER